MVRSQKYPETERVAPNTAGPAGRRPFLAGLLILAGGLAALVLGLVQGVLLNVVGLLGLTLLVAGIVDGTGLRYRGAGTGLLFVFVSAKVIDKAPKTFQQGVAYGALVAAYGAYVVFRERPKGRSAT